MRRLPGRATTHTQTRAEAALARPRRPFPACVYRATIAKFEAYHVVVVAAPVDPRKQERARAFCLERLAWQLDKHRVQLLTLEARPVQLMRRDIRTVDALRSKHALPDGLRIEHALPSTEPMLWIADQVLGALGEAMTNDRDEWFNTVRSSTTIDYIDL